MGTSLGRSFLINGGSEYGVNTVMVSRSHVGGNNSVRGWVSCRIGSRISSEGRSTLSFLSKLLQGLEHGNGEIQKRRVNSRSGGRVVNNVKETARCSSEELLGVGEHTTPLPAEQSAANTEREE